VRLLQVRADPFPRFGVPRSGYSTGMPDPVEKAKDVGTAAAHPVETAHDLATEAARGRSARTPAIAIGGVSLAIGAVLTVLLVVLFLIYYLV
jgi:hypothetical protein